jgi:hypothetical protein
MMELSAWARDILLDLELFVQKNGMKPEDQEHVFSGGDVWTADWWTIEMCRCLRWGEDRYRREPLPPYLEKNSIFTADYFGQDHIIGCCRYKLKNLELVREIPRRPGHRLLSCQIGWGLDIIIGIESGHHWLWFCGYDRVNYGGLLNEFYQPRIGAMATSPMESGILFVLLDTQDWLPDMVTSPTIIFSHHIKLTYDQRAAIDKSPSVTHHIHDGEKIKWTKTE